jgi:uncharacterized protein with PIN domain
MLKSDMVRNEPEPCQKGHKLSAAELISQIKEDRCLECPAVISDLLREYLARDVKLKLSNSVAAPAR